VHSAFPCCAFRMSKSSNTLTALLEKNGCSITISGISPRYIWCAYTLKCILGTVNDEMA